MQEDIFSRAKKIKAVALDGDGVIFTGHVLEGFEGGFGKIRSHADGQGISLLRSSGIMICCITGESGTNARFLESLVEKWNGLPSVKEGRWKPVKVFAGAERTGKTDLLKSWLREHGISLSECAAMGDDMTDCDLLNAVGDAGGLAAAPAQAEEVVKKIVHFVAPRRGGDGAIRDLANLILEAKGVDITQSALR